MKEENKEAMDNSKMKERRWNNKNNEEGRKIYKQINNELRRETYKARAALG